MTPVNDLGQTPVTMTDVTPVKLRRNSSGEPVFNEAEASAACGVSGSTIKRAREAGSLPNAYKETTGRKQWLYPLSDLLAAGLTPTATGHDLGQSVNKPVAQTSVRPRSRRTPDLDQTPVTDDRAARLEQELAATREQLAQAKADARVAQAERDAERRVTAAVEQRADTAERALLMLGAGTPASTEPKPAPETKHETPTPSGGVIEQPRRGRWFGRARRP